MRVEGGKVVEIGGEDSGMTAAPLWFLGPDVLRALGRVPGPPYELASAFRQELDAGIEILAIEVGPTRDLTRPADVVWENFPYLWSSDE